MSFSVKLEPNDEDKSDNEQEPELVIDDDDHEEIIVPAKEVKAELKDPREIMQQSLIAPPATVSDLYSAIASVPRRCETCDIKFTYLKSYLAHKEFYCKERNNNGTSNGPVVVGGNAVNSKIGQAGDDRGMTSPSNGIQSSVANSRAAEVQWRIKDDFYYRQYLIMMHLNSDGGVERNDKYWRERAREYQTK